MQLLGIGRNGHIGFNEPADKFVYGTQIVDLIESTIDANTRFFENKDQVPRKAISLGIGGIMNAKEVVLIAMGADKAQTLKAIKEAESYDGPSVVIAYCPCINHGIKGGMSEAQNQAKRAVEAGYWHMYRFDPRRKAEGKNPFQLDSKLPTTPIRDYMLSEVRYASLFKKFPALAEDLFSKAEIDAKDRMDSYLRLTKD